MKVGFTCGAFDLLHAGHVIMLREAKNLCDVLIVGLQTNPQTDRPEKNKPIQTVYERYLQLVGSTYVDCVIPYDTEQDLCNMLATEPFDIRFVGQEYVGTILTGEHICNSRKIEIVYLPRTHDFSSTNLRERIKNNES